MTRIKDVINIGSVYGLGMLLPIVYYCAISGIGISKASKIVAEVTDEYKKLFEELEKRGDEEI